MQLLKTSLKQKLIFQDLTIEDKSFLHKKHKGHQEGKFHLKIIIKSDELANLNKVVSTKKIYSVLAVELKEYIHSIQILLR